MQMAPRYANMRHSSKFSLGIQNHIVLVVYKTCVLQFFIKLVFLLGILTIIWGDDAHHEKVVSPGVGVLGTEVQYSHQGSKITHTGKPFHI